VYDIVVVGGGTGGLVAAHIAAGTGARVALIERERMGGDCLWTGCVPSKSLIAAASLAQRMRTAPRVGLRAVEPEIDFAGVMEHVHEARRRIAPQDSPERLRAAGVEVIQAEARFTGPRRLVADGRELRFRTALIATGSQPDVPPVPGLHEARPLTNENLWDLSDLPSRLAVLGGGPIGCELGQAFARLGSSVTLIEMLPRLLAREEPRASDLIAHHLAAEGVDVRLGNTVTAVKHGSAGFEIGAGGADPIHVDRILVAAGRRPRTAGLDLDAAGVETDDSGAVVVDRRLRTTTAGIFAAGDVTGELPFTHVAAYHARIAAVNALFLARRTVDHAAVPWVTFTDPEVGRLGKTEQGARDVFGGEAAVVEYEYSELDRAIAAGEDYGFVKLVGDPKGRLVGATVAAPGGGEAVAELAAWLAVGEKIDRVSQTVHAYPTLAEGQARAADEHLRRKFATPRVRSVTRPALRLLRALAR
jgi:pyruvate/2-oxoglutarate dehydrogenase complex dihydrolipoamide dehydrogenase (E3) component